MCNDTEYCVEDFGKVYWSAVRRDGRSGVCGSKKGEGTDRDAKTLVLL